MSNGRQKGKRSDTSRDGGGFIALPWSVMDCPAYAALSHPARSLLMELARQYVRDNNGRLLLSSAYLRPRGWNSDGVVHKAKQELLQAGFIFETVKGQRPHKASWYAVTWRALDKLPGFDEGAEQLFIRGAYRDAPGKEKRAMPASLASKKNAALTPSHGIEGAPIAPSHGVETGAIAPSHGAIKATFGPLSTPQEGNHLEMPSPAPIPRRPLPERGKILATHRARYRPGGLH